MSNYDFAFMGCRLLALWSFLNATYSIYGFLYPLFQIAFPDTNPVNELAASIYMGMVPLLLHTCLGILLWMLAPRLAKSMMRNDGGDETSDSTSLQATQAIALTAVGAFILIGALSEVGSILYGYGFTENVREHDYGSPIFRASAVEVLIRVVLGAALILCAGVFSRILTVLRYNDGKSPT